MMKYKIAVMMLALPLCMSVLAKSASAGEFKAAPNATRSPNVAANRDRADQNRNRQQPPRQEKAVRSEVRRVWVSGHWQQTPRGRQWVPAHYEIRR